MFPSHTPTDSDIPLSVPCIMRCGFVVYKFNWGTELKWKMTEIPQQLRVLINQVQTPRELHVHMHVRRLFFYAQQVFKLKKSVAFFSVKNKKYWVFNLFWIE